MPIISEAVVSVPDLLAGYERYAVANWDCYGAEPFVPETVEAARQLLGILPDTLGKPHISPGPDARSDWNGCSPRATAEALHRCRARRVWGGYWRRTSGERRTIPPKPIDATTEAELGHLFEELST
jgi:hypothetical protein